MDNQPLHVMCSGENVAAVEPTHFYLILFDKSFKWVGSAEAWHTKSGL